MKIRKDDSVLVISGKDRGKKGKVRHAYPEEKKILVGGINFIKRHTRASGRVRQAGIIEREAPIHVSNVMLICSRCNNPIRIGSRFMGEDKKVRICRSCREVIE